jgi:carnitine monooxygenase subunit
MRAATPKDLEALAAGHHRDPAQSLTLRAEAYTEQRWLEVDLSGVFARSWQLVAHVGQLAEPGSYVSVEVARMPIVVVRDAAGVLRGFYNVCKHRAHHLVKGSGTTRALVCPYHSWTYDLTGRLKAARHTREMADFTVGDVCLDQVRVEEFAGFVYVNLEPVAAPLAETAGDLAAEIEQWAPDVRDLRHVRRLTFEAASNWKNVIDNFLECYHCHPAHPEFVSLVDMNTYDVQTYGIWSSHFASAGTQANSAYDVAAASVQDHAVWWLFPNTCLLRYPGRGNFMVFQVFPIAADRTYETWDFYLEDDDPTAAELEAIRYIDEVLQSQDIAIVESVQRGMTTPAFDQGRIVVDPEHPGLSEHAVHHFHGLLLDAYRSYVLQPGH